MNEEINECNIFITHLEFQSLGDSIGWGVAARVGVQFRTTVKRELDSNGLECLLTPQPAAHILIS